MLEWVYVLSHRAHGLFLHLCSLFTYFGSIYILHYRKFYLVFITPYSKEALCGYMYMYCSRFCLLGIYRNLRYVQIVYSWIIRNTSNHSKWKKFRDLIYTKYQNESWRTRKIIIILQVMLALEIGIYFVIHAYTFSDPLFLCIFFQVSFV